MNPLQGNTFILFSRKRIPSLVRNFAIPLITVAISVGVKVKFSLIFGENAPFLLLYIPIIICAGFGGITAGVIATVLSSIAIIYFFFPPFQNFIIHPISLLQVVTFFFEGLIISSVIEALHVARDSARNALMALRSSEERYKLIVENATDYAIFMLDKSGKILSWNSGAKKLLGYSAREIVGKNFKLFFIPEDKRKNLPKKELQKALATGKATDDNWVVGKKGHRFWGSGMTMPIRNEQETVIGFEKIIRDSTDVKEEQEKRDDFISIATHELRTPVTSMNAYFDVLQRRLKKEKNREGIELFGKVDNQLHKLTVLIQDLLDVSRIQNKKLALNKERMHVNDLVKEVVEDMQQTSRSHKIQLRGKVRNFIYVDKSRISQVLRNLISNGIRYSPEGKKIIVSSERKRKQVKISVQDFGIGISKEDQQKIFDRFYRAHTGGKAGLGLGLFIAREIIRQHKGGIGVSSVQGKGATFYIKLPLSENRKKRYSEKSGKGGDDNGSKNVSEIL